MHIILSKIFNDNNELINYVKTNKEIYIEYYFDDLKSKITYALVVKDITMENYRYNTYTPISLKNLKYSKLSNRDQINIFKIDKITIK